MLLFGEGGEGSEATEPYHKYANLFKYISSGNSRQDRGFRDRDQDFFVETETRDFFLKIRDFETEFRDFL